MLITIVVTSAVIFVLVRADVIHVKPQTEEVSLLDMEFLPYAAENILVIKEFQFCGSVDETYVCQNPTERFKVGDKVYFRFVVETSNLAGQLQLTENYIIKGPDGKILLNVDQRKNFDFVENSNQKESKVKFKDYFFTEQGDPTGEYILELLVTNPMIGKEVKLVKELQVENE